MDKEKLKWLMAAALCCAVLASWVGAHAQEQAQESTGATVKLRILETTDIHTNIVNYDYYRDEPTDEFGLAKTATLIKAAQGEAQNVPLIR